MRADLGTARRSARAGQLAGPFIGSHPAREAEHGLEQPLDQAAPVEQHVGFELHARRERLGLP